MHLLLVRHGDAVSSAENGDKLLSPLGHSEILKTARMASQTIDFRLQNIYHSGKIRARQTAEILSEIIKSENKLKQASGLGPLDSLSIWANRLKTLDVNIALVGHLPYMAEMTSYLTKKAHDVQFYTATIVHLTRNSDKIWKMEQVFTTHD